MAQASGPSHGAPRRTRPVAVVADMSAEVRQAVHSVLERFAGPIDVAEAATGREALHLLLDATPDLAFVNLQLRDLSGAEALAFARAHDVSTLAFLMSSQVQPRWIEIATELNAYDFLRTPFDREHLVALLSNWRRMAEPSSLLLVDDTEASRRHLRGVLANTRFPLALDEAQDTAQALALIERNRYAAALITCTSGDLGWIELAAHARSLSPSTKLILLAATESPALGEVARLGLATILRRPFYAPDFDYHFHTLFGLRRPYLLNALRTSAEGRPARASCSP